ncbi:hypothetical protein [Marispirochaeta sp.]|uniref:hypothetical protein n=1 Tax=Marispirochaeta sp. TaxID=2038653 RepID=UPI0029C79299|nr:hypothetical protein [Marispirochaeta sp.]
MLSELEITVDDPSIAPDLFDRKTIIPLTPGSHNESEWIPPSPNDQTLGEASEQEIIEKDRLMLAPKTKREQQDVSEDTANITDNNHLIKFQENSLVALQKWEGTVVSVNKEAETFVARILDQTNPDELEEIVEFDFEEVPDKDWQLIEKGSIFYWSIGYSYVDSKTKVRQSIIRFKMKLRLNKHQKTTADKETEQLMRILDIASKRSQKR